MKSGPVDYRVRFSGEGAGAWKPLHFDKLEPFAEAVGQALIGARP